MYSLQATLTHTGTLEHGHYMADVVVAAEDGRTEDVWHYNDTQVSQQPQSSNK